MKLGADRQSWRSWRRPVTAMWAQDIGVVVGVATRWPEPEKKHLMHGGARERHGREREQHGVRQRRGGARERRREVEARRREVVPGEEVEEDGGAGEEEGLRRGGR